MPWPRGLKSLAAPACPAGKMRLLIIGNRGGTNVGSSFERAAGQLGHSVSVLEPSQAYAGPRWLQRLNWWMRGRRPCRLAKFDKAILAEAGLTRPDVMLSVGIAPPGKAIASELRRQKIKLLNYLTDDPWQKGLCASWFIRSLQSYNVAFSTKQALLGDLRKKVTNGEVHYLPFAFDPELHFFDKSKSDAAQKRLDCDVYFAGGADRDRFPYLRALINAGLSVAIHGGYWDRDPMTKTVWLGHANPQQLRIATADAKICLCLVRRANRDGHVMRSFEIAAMRGCLLMEDTLEHRELFGPDGECAVYFRDLPEMVAKAKDLLPRVEERSRLAAAAHHRICAGGHTYADRLRTMLAE